jgi:dephospho-CoA kinase
MRRVALTGGIATGKSTVAATLRALQVPVVDADVLAREAVAPGTEGLRLVAERFGAGVVGADGALDRAGLGRLVFADVAARRALEQIVHPRVRAAVAAFFAAAAAPAAVAEIPLVYESGRAADFDAVVVVACHPHEQLRRLMARDGMSEAEARARIAAQWPIEDKARLADRVILAEGGLAATARQAEHLARWLGATS